MADLVATAAELVVRAQQGDARAESELCARLAPAVAAFARRRLRTADAVREMQQDVMLLFVDALRRGAVEDPARVGGFVLGICKNLARDRAKQRERRDALWELYGADVLPHAPSAPEHASEDIIRLEDCLSQLSQRARDVVWLSYGESRAHAEIAERLQISEANARVMRHRTLAALRDCMRQTQTSWEAA